MGSLFLILMVIVVIPTGMAEEEEEDVIPERIFWTLGVIGMIFGLAAVFFAVKTLTHITGLFKIPIWIFSIGIIFLSIASVTCFMGHIHHLYSERTSVFIEHQLRLFTLILWAIGFYMLYNGLKEMEKEV